MYNLKKNMQHFFSLFFSCLEYLSKWGYELVVRNVFGIICGLITKEHGRFTKSRLAETETVVVANIPDIYPNEGKLS